MYGEQVLARAGAGQVGRAMQLVEPPRLVVEGIMNKAFLCFNIFIVIFPVALPLILGWIYPRKSRLLNKYGK